MIIYLLMSTKKWWSEGVRFECQGSGKCCMSRGQYGYVYFTLKDRKRIARHLGISTSEFTKKYCAKTNGYFHLKHSKDEVDCRFLSDKKCTVYEARPTQCRTWPFWPEVMYAKTWTEEVKSFCPGVGKGRLYTAEEIKARLDSADDFFD